MSQSRNSERPLQEIWPSTGVFLLARQLGLCLEHLPGGGYLHIVSLRNLVALLLGPIFAVLYLARFTPRRCLRYLLTNRRLVKRRGLVAQEVAALPLEDFDSIELEALPGQTWFASADLRFLRAGEEVFRLASVQNPETFRQACLTARRSYLSVRSYLGEAPQPVPTGPSEEES